MKIFLTFLASGWLLQSATGAAHNRFAAIPKPTLTPRFYPAASIPQVMQKREGGCAANSHPCEGDIGAVGANLCCGDTKYCMVDPANSKKALCCALGDTCGSPCSRDQYQCELTKTITSGAVTTTTVEPACCGRKCPKNSMYVCPSSLGGACCSYGEECASGGLCLKTQTAAPSATSPARDFPNGCTTNQIACPSNYGGGCCDDTHVCTFATATTGIQGWCAAATPTGVTVAPVGNSNDLGTGAKIGIAVGVVLVAAVVIGALTWWCVRQRRAKSQAASQRASMPPVPPSDGQGMTEAHADMLPRERHTTQQADYFVRRPHAVSNADSAPYDVHSVGSGPSRGYGAGLSFEPNDNSATAELDSRASPEPAGHDDTYSQRSGRSPAMNSPPMPQSIQERFEEHRYEMYAGDLPMHVADFPSPAETTQVQTPPDDTYPLSPESVYTPQDTMRFYTQLRPPTSHEDGARR